MGTATRDFDLALGHGSNDVTVAARLLRIPCATTFDYEWATVQHNVNCRLAQAVVVPDVIPPERLYRYGAHGKLHPYAGLKEEYYLGDFEPDPAVLGPLGLDAARPIAVIRTPPAVSLYHRFENDLFAEVLRRLRGEQVVVLPRTPEQRAELARDGGFIVPEHAIDAQSLIAFADLVISAGGTMNREAVALGTPVFTVFEGRLGAVDEDADRLRTAAATRRSRPGVAGEASSARATGGARIRRDPAVLTELLRARAPRASEQHQLGNRPSCRFDSAACRCEPSERGAGAARGSDVRKVMVVQRRLITAAVLMLLGLALPAGAQAMSWEAATTVSAPGEIAYQFSPTVAMDAAGDTIAAWLRITNTGGTGMCPCTVRAAYHPAGGAWQAPVDVSPAIANPNDAGSVLVAMDAAGDAIVGWNAPASPADPVAVPDTAYAAIRPAGGAFGPAITLDRPRGHQLGGASLEDLAVDAAGDAVALVDNEQHYTGAGGAPHDAVFDAEVVRGTLTGGFDTAHPQILTDGVHDGFGRAIAMSPGGRAALVLRQDVVDEAHPGAPEPDSVLVATSGAPGTDFGAATTLQTVTPAAVSARSPIVDAAARGVAIDDAGDYIAGYTDTESAQTLAKASVNGGAPVVLNGPGVARRHSAWRC